MGKKILGRRRMGSLFVAISALMMVGGGLLGVSPFGSSAKALSITPVTFAATGHPTSYTNNITTPPILGQGFELKENVTDNSTGAQLGTDDIKCYVAAFTTSAVQFACTATMNLVDGSFTALATFSATQTGTQPHYDAVLVPGLGTGRYAHVVGTVHVSDSGPGNPTGYVLDAYRVNL